MASYFRRTYLVRKNMALQVLFHFLSAIPVSNKLALGSTYKIIYHKIQRYLYLFR